jgi:hypothetical protein
MVIGPNLPAAPASQCIVGLDIGQRIDYSAIAVLDCVEEVTGFRDPATYEFLRHRTIALRHVERIRLGTAFASVVDRVGEIVSHPALAGCTLVVDATGVGAPVVELLRAAKLPCRLIPAQITGGLDESSDGVYYRVPKRDLVTGLQVLFDRWPFEIQADTPGVDALIQELVGFKATSWINGNMRFGGAKDDLTMALALAWWWMRKRVAWRPPPDDPDPGDFLGNAYGSALRRTP